MKFKRILYYAVIPLARNLLIYSLCILLYFMIALTFSYSENKAEDIARHIERIYQTEPIYVYLENKYNNGIIETYAESIADERNIEKYYYQKNTFTDAYIKMPNYPDYTPQNEPSELPRFRLVCVDSITNYIKHNDIDVAFESVELWTESSVLIAKELAEYNGLSVGDNIVFQYYRQGGTAYKECVIFGIYDTEIDNNLTMYVSLDGFRDYINNTSVISHNKPVEMLDKAVYKVIDNHSIKETRAVLLDFSTEAYQLTVDDTGFISHISSLTQQRDNTELFALVISIGLALCSLCFSVWFIYEAFRDIKYLWELGADKYDVIRLCFLRYSIFFIICGLIICVIQTLPAGYVIIYSVNYILVMLFSLCYCVSRYRIQKWR